MILHFLVLSLVLSKSTKYTYPVAPTPNFPSSTSNVALEPISVDLKWASPLNKAVLSPFGRYVSASYHDSTAL